MDFDFSPPRRVHRHKKRPPVRHIVLILTVAIVAALVLLNRNEPELKGEASVAPAELHVPQEPTQPPEPQREVVHGTIKQGETLTSLLGTFFTPQQIHEISQQSRDVFPLSRICTGQPYRLCIEDGAFASFIYEIDSEEELHIRRNQESFDIARIPIPYSVETVLVRGTIETSLFEAVAKSGEGPEVAVALADIFAWDIDFIRDLRRGDSFQALVEKRSREGKPAGYGRILAAEFSNNGETFQAVRFTDGEHSASYYDPQGNNLRKAFLRAPLSFTRISSGFTLKRFHPIAKTWRAHPAIDYAAPRGTPIMTVGDGTITRVRYDKNNGNHIKIRHNATYETLYLHMSRFAKGMKKGKRVSQGQTIGYVGSTGLATGPHLCFRMYRYGKPVNPYKVKAPASKPVSENQIDLFHETSASLLAKFTEPPTEKQSRVAATETQ